MKQTFVVPIYRNDPNNYITHVVRSPLNSKRIAKAFISVMHSGGDYGGLADTDKIGIYVDGTEVIPDNFPASLLNTQYYTTNIKDNPEAEEISINSKFPNFTAFPIDKPAMGSKIEINYKTSISDFVIVFECDDLPISTVNYCYRIEEFRHKPGSWVRQNAPGVDLNLTVQKIIETTGMPVAISARPVVFQLQEGLAMYAFQNGGLFWGSLQKNPKEVIHEFPQSWYSEVNGGQIQKKILTEWLGMTTMDIICGNGKEHFKNIDIPLFAPTSSLPLANSFVEIKTDSRVLDVAMHIPFFLKINEFAYRGDQPFTDACIQLIIKYQK